MNMYKKFQSPLGYQATDSLIDSYGVDHSGFSIRDELEYQFDASGGSPLRSMAQTFGAILIITMVSALQTFTAILRIGIIIHLKTR